MTKPRPLVGLPTLTWVRAFEAAARTSSFSAAALELRLTPGAISYQIRALEAHLGFALFERLPRGVKLTPMGVAYLPPVRKAFEQLADSTVGLFGGSERREISIHAPVSLASLWLAPKLPAFSRAFPGIDVRLLSVIWDHPAPTENTDLEIRYGAGQWRGYASAFSMYAAARLALPEHRLPPGVPFAAWFHQNEPALRACAVLRDKDTIIASQMLPILEATPSGWEALCYLNLGTRDLKKPLARHFTEWGQNVSSDLRPFVSKIAALFEVAV